MGFVDWWKKSSQEASAAHYALRFEEAEINELRRGVLSETAKLKIRRRLKSVGKLDKGVMLGCGIPAGCFSLIILSTFGFFIVRAILRGINPVTVGFALFFTLFLLIFFGLGLSGARAYFKMKKAVAEDLSDVAAGIERGQINAIIEHSRNNFTIKYKMNGVEYPIIRDAIGSEIHDHFWGGNNLTGKSTYQTSEFYKFYFLPKSKTLLYFERD